ncbi:MAG: autotransporter outer membrane beta-barrel domain-containing protein [Mesorhizobium sp.]|nr:autotransporter outer membrane beta-barrel domain-containing protein [Mesorhizobium sp.]MBL8579235.1 autotransporter outer membrane beta-barrel domain-containing protein [Mesorhizobium sp.]
MVRQPCRHYGFGDAGTSQAGGGVSTASYGIRTWGAQAETGYRFDFDGGSRITPSVGLDYTDMRSGGFTETGGLALSARDYSTARHLLRRADDRHRCLGSESRGMPARGSPTSSRRAPSSSLATTAASASASPPMPRQQD